MNTILPIAFEQARKHVPVPAPGAQRKTGGAAAAPAHAKPAAAAKAAAAPAAVVSGSAAVPKAATPKAGKPSEGLAAGSSEVHDAPDTCCAIPARQIFTRGHNKGLNTCMQHPADACIRGALHSTALTPPAPARGGVFLGEVPEAAEAGAKPRCRADAQFKWDVEGIDDAEDDFENDLDLEEEEMGGLGAGEPTAATGSSKPADFDAELAEFESAFE